MEGDNIFLPHAIALIAQAEHTCVALNQNAPHYAAHARIQSQASNLDVCA